MSYLHFLMGLALYLILVRFLRFRNVRALRQKYSQYLANPYSMDYKTAHEILKITMTREFPWTFKTSTSFALLKSYATPSGTELLARTRQLTSPKKVGKRAEDTGVFLTELLETGIDSERGMRALSKMNWLHRRYEAKITNDEMIHTLALFVLEPQRWIDEMEWRQMTGLENAAAFIYWKEIGARMGMKSVPGTLDELKIWTAKYEKTEMYYADSNRECMKATMDLFLRDSPLFLHPFVWNIMAALLEPHVRDAVGMEHPPVWISTFVWAILKARACFIELFAFPRSGPRRSGIENGKDGRLYRKEYLFEPWYVKQTTWSRLMNLLVSNRKPRPGPEFKPGGYLPEELGPSEYEEKSRESVLTEAAEMRAYADQGGSAVLGCPFSFSRRN